MKYFIEHPLLSSLIIIIIFILLIVILNLYSKNKNIYSRIIALLKKNDYQKALKLLNSHRESLDPSFFYCYSILALTKLRRYIEALKLEPLALAEPIIETGLYNNLGYTYYKIGNYEKAIAYSEKSLEFNKDDLFALSNLGFSYFNKKEFEKSHYYFEKSLLINPNYIHGLTGEAFYFYLKEDFEKTVDYFKKLSLLTPTDSNVFRRLGECYFYLNNLSESEKAYEKAYNLAPSDCRICCEYANILLYLDKLEKANNLLTFVLTCDSLSSIAYYSKGRISALLREKELALFYLEKAFLLNPNLKKLAEDDGFLNNLRFFEEFNELLTL